MSSSRSQKQRPKSDPDRPAAGHLARNIREIVEAIAVAFVLAFLFRTFEAEAFVIPTGSMAPTLQGRHKDVACPQCGHPYQASASSEEGAEIQQLRAQLKSGRGDQRTYLNITMHDTVAGTCPICRYTAIYEEIDDRVLADERERSAARSLYDPQRSYNGDRILVSKFAYAFGEPKRWDVVVFKYPGDANQNYIKRLVGLPGETIQIYDGDILVKNRQGGRGPRDLDAFTIERKPPRKVLSMMQPIHDTDHDPSSLRKAGWPLRWSPWPTNNGAAGAWRVEENTDGKRVEQKYSSDGISGDGVSGDGMSDDVAWLRYEHRWPELEDWLAVIGNGGPVVGNGGPVVANVGPVWDDASKETIKPRLITDMYAYNTEVLRGQVVNHRSLRMVNARLGLHWVGDLLLECQVDVAEATGELLLDLVEAGKHFTCTIDLASGQATLAIDGLSKDDFATTAQTSIDGPGAYRIRFGNVDDQLLLWVNDRLVDFGGEDGSAEYDVAAVFGSRDRILPQPNRTDDKTGHRIAGDLAPVGVGSRGAKVTIERLRVLRDLYYIADKQHSPGGSNPITELPRLDPAFIQLDAKGIDRAGLNAFLTHPATAASLYSMRRHVEFPLKRDAANPDGDQFFVLGDNSPSSMDSRLWAQLDQDRTTGGAKRPGGSFVERKLLIGKALFVFWPHSWDRIPGIGIPLPFFPNVGAMRRIR